MPLNDHAPPRQRNRRQTSRLAPQLLAQRPTALDRVRSDLAFALQVESRPVSALKPSPHNARTHSGKQVRQVTASIKQFGFNVPILIDANNQIIAGHCRWLAAQRMGRQDVPTIRLNHLSEPQKRAYMIADNRLAEKAGWDKALLRVELDYLSGHGLEFDLEITGFETAEIDLFMDVDTGGSDGDDRLPPEDGRPAVARIGDLWQLGRHRLLCGDARDGTAYARLMQGETARMAFTDPPYNVRIEGHVSGLGRVRHGDFVMASGEMTEAQFTAFLTTVLGHHAAHAVDGSIHYVCMDWRHIGEILSAGGRVYTELKNLCVWNKDNAGMGTFYRSKHELVFVYKYGTAPHINNFELGQHGRYRTNVWDYAGTNALRPGGADELAMHPTVKPVAMVVDAIKDCSRRGEIVLDGFGGSGTTIIAAAKTGRIARVLELDPQYVDVILRRWEAWSEQPARLEETGQTFEEVAAARRPTLGRVRRRTPRIGQ